MLVHLNQNLCNNLECSIKGKDAQQRLARLPAVHHCALCDVAGGHARIPVRGQAAGGADEKELAASLLLLGAVAAGLGGKVLTAAP